MLLRKTRLLEKTDGCGKVIVNLRVDLLDRAAPLAFRGAGRRFGVDRHSGQILVPLVSLLERLDKHEIRIRTHCIGLGHHVFELIGISCGGIAGRDNVVHVVDDFVKVLPREIAAPYLAGVPHSLFVTVVLEKPPRAFGRMHHVVAHEFCCQYHGHVAETLVRIGRNEVDTVVHRGVDAVHGHLYGLDVFEYQILVHLAGRRCLHHVGTSGRKHARRERYRIYEFFHSCEFRILSPRRALRSCSAYMNRMSSP